MDVFLGKIDEHAITLLLQVIFTGSYYTFRYHLKILLCVYDVDLQKEHYTNQQFTFHPSLSAVRRKIALQITLK